MNWNAFMLGVVIGLVVLTVLHVTGVLPPL